jgi:hypothetical protein
MRRRNERDDLCQMVWKRVALVVQTLANTRHLAVVRVEDAAPEDVAAELVGDGRAQKSKTKQPSQIRIWF